MKKSLIFLTAAFLFANPTKINLKITNSTLSGYIESGVNQENVKLRGLFLYNDREDKQNFYLAGIKAEGNLIGVDGVKFSLITDYVHTKRNSAIALGAGVFSFIPHFNIPLFMRIEGEYAPEVLSFDKADRFSRVDVSFGYIPIENGELFVGYRNISFNKNYNSSFYAGLGYSF